MSGLEPVSLRVLYRAMYDSDHWVVQMRYTDARGNTTTRIISPIRFVNGDKVMALCLARTEPRLFRLANCTELTLLPASDVLMPMPIIEHTNHTVTHEANKHEAT